MEWEQSWGKEHWEPEDDSRLRSWGDRLPGQQELKRPDRWQNKGGAQEEKSKRGRDVKDKETARRDACGKEQGESVTGEGMKKDQTDRGGEEEGGEAHEVKKREQTKDEVKKRQNKDKVPAKPQLTEKQQTVSFAIPRLYTV